MYIHIYTSIWSHTHTLYSNLLVLFTPQAHWHLLMFFYCHCAKQPTVSLTNQHEKARINVCYPFITELVLHLPTFCYQRLCHKWGVRGEPVSGLDSLGPDLRLPEENAGPGGMDMEFLGPKIGTCNAGTFHLRGHPIPFWGREPKLSLGFGEERLKQSFRLSPGP